MPAVLSSVGEEFLKRSNARREPDEVRPLVPQFKVASWLAMLRMCCFWM